MPYVTKISTPNRSNSGLKDNNIRSASGKYSVIKGSTSDFIEVYGFNLNPEANDVRIVNSTTAAGSSVTATSGEKATRSSAASNGYTLFKLSNALSKSGYLEVFTNGVRSLNNINNNDAHGSFERTSSVEDYKNMSNRVNEADFYTTKNVQLTDDRYLRFFDIKKTNTKNGYYPVMIMDDDDPVFGFVDSTGRHSDDRSVSMSFPTDMQPQRRKFNSDGTYTSLNTEYLVSGTVWEQMAMAKDDAGKYHQVSVYDRTTGSMGYFYQKYASSYTTDSGYDGRQMGYGYSDYTPNVSQSANNNALTLDGMNAGALLVGRYQSIKLLAKGDSTTSEGATVYQAYYDDYTGELVFRDFKVAQKTLTAAVSNVTFTYSTTYPGFLYNNSTAAGTDYSNYYVKIDDEYYSLTRKYQGNNNKKYYYTLTGYSGTANFTSDVYSFTALSGTWYDMYGGYCTNLNENTSYTSYAQGRNTVTSTGSKYYDFGVTSNRVVFVYYDLEEGRLRLMYSSADVTGDPSTAVTFTENTSVKLPDYVGQYVSMVIDSNGGIHIAAFDANDSDLKYIYLTSYDAASYTQMTVDAAGSVGNWTSIKIDTNSSHPYYNKPVIAYYNATETGGRDAIKLAYANAEIGSITEGIDSSTTYTSTGWEYMTIPSVDPAQGGSQKFQQVCLDFDSNGIPVVGYLGTNLEFGKWLTE